MQFGKTYPVFTQILSDETLEVLDEILEGTHYIKQEVTVRREGGRLVNEAEKVRKWINGVHEDNENEERGEQEEAE